MDCLFCKIVSGEIPSTKVFENEKVLAFRDIAPQAPVHIIVIPKEHVLNSADDVRKENSAVISEIFETIPKIAEAEGLSNGYRIISNVGEDGAQTVRHIHFHLLGGAPLSEKVC